MNGVVPTSLTPKMDYMTGNNKTKSGFTIIELIVGLAIFSLAATIAVALLTTALRAQRKSIAIQNAFDNGRYLIGFMAKEIRMSEITSFDGEIYNLNIVHPINGNVTYSFSGNNLLRNSDQINSDEVRVTGRFVVDGKAPSGDDEQPRVTIVMEVETNSVKVEEKAEIRLQTTLSQRNLE